MIWNEEIYLLISELITMPDRDLAQRIELAIFIEDYEPNEKRLDAFLKMYNECSDGSEFYGWAYEYLQTLNESNKI